MTWIDRDEISKYLGVQPIELDSIELSPTRRRRLYWTNIPHPARLPRVKDHPSTFVQSCLHDAIALEEKTGVTFSFTFLDKRITVYIPVLAVVGGQLRNIREPKQFSLQIGELLYLPPLGDRNS
jgi:hypothetical protein